jgi:signal transduction histidine kinase
MIGLSYLVLYSRGTPVEVAGLFVGLCLGSNLVLMRLPERVVRHRAFDLILVTFDVALTTVGLWLCGNAGPDFYFLFFFVVFLAAVGDHPELTAVGAALAAVANLALIYHGPLWDSAILLRIPFLFVTALSYGYMAMKAREAGARAKTIEALLDSMSQEVRNPLRRILEYSDLLRDQTGLGELSPTQREGIARINAQAADLLSIVVGRMHAVLDGPGQAAIEPELADFLRARAAVEAAP